MTFENKRETVEFSAMGLNGLPLREVNDGRLMLAWSLRRRRPETWIFREQV